ncbi:SDR family oxidoreductase [Lentzea sp. NBRC 102530]|uniref:SDR family NAD(P)-dependent oxidoreductase n=1 Tax=Lentzea sp. NBRC 102530 TaxID=3032201 RepID=UPI0025557380|nr:SDR family oxidoreductase [Lentzea sp. NBRC 102530]
MGVDFGKQTVLVTGASSGIGAEFARRLAARGSSLVLVARRKDRLEELAAELRAKHGVTVHVVAADLAQPGIGARLAGEVAEFGVTSLINNAGFANFGAFHENEPERLRQEVAVDVNAVVEISRAFIEPLRANGHGFLINLASMAAYQGTPWSSVYGATKAFVVSFTEGLWIESQGTGLRVMVLSPGATRTEFAEVSGIEEMMDGLRTQTAGEVVTTAFKALDRRVTPVGVISGRMNRVLAFTGRHFTSRAMGARLIGRMSRQS